MRKEGFTILELIISLSLIAALAVLTFPSYSRWHNSSQLDGKTEDIVSALRLAQYRALSSFEEADQGVKIAEPGMVMFTGSNYETREQEYDRSISFDEPIAVSSDFVDNQIIFLKSTGQPDATGIFIVSNGGSGQSFLIEVNEFGLIRRSRQ